MRIYEVALWLRFQGDEIPYSSERVEACSSFEAVLLFMQQCGVKRVAYAAVCSLVDGCIDRWVVGRGFWMRW